MDARVESVERRTLQRQVTAGSAARQELVLHNLRLVWAIARRYSTPGHPREDAFQDVLLGLLRAADGYDPQRGHRFSTYATWWIRQSARRGLLEQGRSVRLPEYAVAIARRLRRADGRLQQTLGRPPTTVELAAATELPVSTVESLLAAGQPPASLDAPLAEDLALGDLLTAPDRDPGDEVAARASSRLLGQLLAQLPHRQQLILTWRSGLDGRPPLTYVAVAGRLGISYQRACQIERQALSRLACLAAPLRPSLGA
jgi:RNA polymerase primary sigma factor